MKTHSTTQPICRGVAAILAACGLWCMSGAMELAGNFWVNADFGSDLPFIDLMQMARPWTIAEMDDPGGCPSGLGYTNEYPFPCRSVPSTVTIPSDSNGYPLEIPFTSGGKQYRVVAVMLAGSTPAFRPTGQYVLLFEGTGTIELAWDFGPLQTVTGNGGRSRYVFTMTNPSYSPPFRGSLLCIKRSQAGDHIRNIHIVPLEREHDFQRKVFRDAFMKDLQPYSTLRFMDWCAANWSVDVQWSDRTRPTYYCQTNGFSKGARGTAYEYMILLCNKLLKNAWICVPPQANEDYQRKLAELIRDRLDPRLKVYIEWANETWNGMFWSAQYASQQASQLGISGWCYHGVAAARLFRVFDEVFGTSINRVVKVLSGQDGNWGVIDCILQTFNNRTYNPWSTRANALATAVYFSRSPNTGNLQAHRSRAQQWGLRCISYEGGDRYGNYDSYRSALTVFDDYLDLYNQYTVIGMEWGAKKFTGQPITQPTAGPHRALLEYAMTNNGLDTNAAVVKTQAEPWWLPNTPAQPNIASRQVPAPHLMVPRFERGHFVVEGSTGDVVRVRIISATGRELFGTQGLKVGWPIKVDGLAPGAYAVEIVFGTPAVRRVLAVH